MTKIVIKEGQNLYPEGLYVLQVKSIKPQVATTGTNAGGSFLVWESEVLQCTDNPEMAGEIYKHITPAGCSPKSKYFRLFSILGVSLAEGQKEVEFDTDDLIDGQFVAEVAIEKVEAGKNAGGERNFFKQLWSIEEFQQHLDKAHSLRNKLTNTANPQQHQPTTVTAPPVNVLQHSSVGNKSPLNLPGGKLPANNTAAKLTDFPE